MASLRQRIPFRFSEDDVDDDRILDEQEQEELIHKLRDEHLDAWTKASWASHLVLILSAILQVVYVVKLDKTPPVYAILPSATLVSSTAVPLPNLFALLNIVLHNNLAFQDHLPSWIPHSCLSLAKRCFPIPLLHPLTIGLTLLAPILALLRGGSWPDVVWWCITPGMSWIVWYIHRWYVQMNEELLALERLRYDAKGA